jgi:hypothetical protein
MYVFGGTVFVIPHHAIVMMFGFSILPHDTITAGNGPTIVPAFNLLFIFLPFSTFSLREDSFAL